MRLTEFQKELLKKLYIKNNDLQYDKFHHLINSKLQIVNENNFIYEMECIFDKLNLKDSKILDIGCGKGLMSIYLSMKFPTCKIYAMDSNIGNGSEINILDYLKDYIKKYHFNNIKVMEQDYNNYHFLNKFEVIVSRHSIHHLPNIKYHHLYSLNRKKVEDHNFKEYVKVFRKLHYDLNDNGILVFSDVCRDTVLRFLPFFIGRKIRNIRWNNKPFLKDWEKFITLNKFRYHEQQYLNPYSMRNYKFLHNRITHSIFSNIYFYCFK